MIKRKICLLGAPGVGKTSLVARFVKSVFSEKYQATVGAKVDKKTVQVNGEDVQLVIWDMAGDSAERLSHSPYLRGAAGHLVVADGTQPESMEEAHRVVQEVTAHYGPLPLVFLVNKNDLANLWRVTAGGDRATWRRAWQAICDQRQDRRGRGTGVCDAGGKNGRGRL